MLTGPAPAAKKALARARMRVEQIDLFEVNEAFGQCIGFIIKTPKPLCGAPHNELLVISKVPLVFKVVPPRVTPSSQP